MIPFSLWFVDNLGGYASEMQPVHCFAYHLVNPKPSFFSRMYGTMVLGIDKLD